jgi:hypothetical protein
MHMPPMCLYVCRPSRSSLHLVVRTRASVSVLASTWQSNPGRVMVSDSLFSFEGCTDNKAVTQADLRGWEGRPWKCALTILYSSRRVSGCHSRF